MGIGEMGAMTKINQAAATRRFHQGLSYLLGTSGQGRKPDPEMLLAVATVMAYLGAYAFPDCNRHELKQRMLFTFEPLKKDAVDVDPLVDRALDLAEVFRRPWTEPGDPDGPTI